MPRIGDAGDMEIYQIAGSNFTFQGARITHLKGLTYTLVTIAVDETGSIQDFADELRQSLVSAVEACRKSPFNDSILIRVITFSTRFKDGVNEIHGFKRLVDIDTNDYPQFRPDGMTPLFDATFSAVGAMVDYGADLMAQDFTANGIVFVITDGANNHSIATPMMIREQIRKVTQEEKLESLVTVLVGINAMEYQNELMVFQTEAGLDQYIDVGEVTSGKLAKLADFVSQSISSQSLAIGTGGPSQNIPATI